jgi:transposase-like protein
MNKEQKTTEDTTKKIIEIDDREVRGHLRELVRGSVEETLNGLLDAEADALCGAGRYERSPDRVDSRAGSYKRGLETQAGKVELNIPKLRTIPFETQIIERYRRRESSVEEALIEMYLAGVSVRRVEDITQALWGTRVSPGTVSNLNQKVYERIDEWRTRKLTGEYPYVYLDGIWLKRSWGGEIKNVSVLVAVGVTQDGFREIIGAAEGEKEDKAGWLAFLRQLKQRGLTGVRLIVSDKCLGLVESIAEVFPDADWQRCVVHWYRNIFKDVPRQKIRIVAAMLKAIHAQEDRAAALEKAQAVVEKLKEMKLHKAAKHVLDSVAETLSYMGYPEEHWRKIRTNNPLERIMKEIRRRTRVVGSFPDGQSALMLVAARLRHIAGTKWGTRRYLSMERLYELEQGRKVA